MVVRSALAETLIVVLAEVPVEEAEGSAFPGLTGAGPHWHGRRSPRRKSTIRPCAPAWNLGGRKT
jgi:hypothetical protein